MTTWYWIRHGPTHERAFVGWRDVPADLSDTAQILRLQRYLPSKAILVSSDLSRCIKTADAIAHDLHTRLPHAPEIREFNFGDWDGMDFEAVSAKDPVLSRAYWETPGDVTPPNGESWNEAAARVNYFVDQVNTAFPESHIIAVAHFGVILTQVQRALGITAYAACAHKIDNLSATELHHATDQWACNTINHIP